jgi:hypothetical protein
MPEATTRVALENVIAATSTSANLRPAKPIGTEAAGAATR